MTLRVFVFLVILCVILAPGALGAKILGVFHVPTLSHHTIGSTLLKGLAAKGHEVTLISPFPLREKVANYTDIPLGEMQDIQEGKYPPKTSDNNSHVALFTFFYEVIKVRNGFIKAHNVSPWQMVARLYKYFNVLSEITLRNAGVQDLLKSDDKFDLIIIETFANEALFGLGHRFNAPIMVVCTSTSLLVNHLNGNLSPSSFVPQFLTAYSDKMSMIERYFNTGLWIYFDLLQRSMSYPFQEQLYYEYFGDGPPFEQITKNVSLILINSNTFFETPRPYLPNMISIGGIHIQEPKPLPLELKQFLDDATEGAIFFSLGSNLHSKDLPMAKRTMILNALAKLPQRTVWKFEEEDLPGKPENVRIGNWFPQNDILAHPNVKLFITHGGLLSSTEAVYRGVPVLVIPFYADQHLNTASILKFGNGLKLQFSDLTEELFSEKIREILKNPKYQIAIQRSSAIIKDQPMEPLEKAIYWTEYVMKHKGAPHLRAASVDLSLIEYFLIDVIAVTVVVLSTFIIGSIFVYQRLLGALNVIPKTIKSKLA